MNRIHVRKLAERAVTRSRAQEAVRNLVPLLERTRDQELQVELDDVPMISGSFLDEFVLQLHAHGALSHTTLVTSQAETLRKLRRIAGTRRFALYHREGAGTARHLVDPLSEEPEVVSRESRKPAA